MIWASGLGAIMCFSGLWIGIWVFWKNRKKGLRSPYKKWWLRWHHITGVVFGVFALTFVFSGMMSLVDIPSWMQKGKTRNREVRFRGREGGMLAADLYALDYRKIVDSLSDVKSIEWASFGKYPYYVVNSGSKKQFIDAADTSCLSPFTLTEEMVRETVREIQTINSMIPIWKRRKSEVTEEEYNNFYKEKFFDFEDPIATIHVSVEGAVTYKALLYIPARAPYDFYTKDFKKGLQLYSSGVMIMENCEELLPDCFRFVRGVVDSQDLSLNISREMLQHDRQLKFIAGNLEKKIKTELQKLMDNDREKYEKFYAAFGMQIKYGVLNDYGAKKELLQDLLLYWSHKQNKLVSFKEYADAMPEEQKYIYFASGENRQRLSQLPQLEKLTEKGFDVLLMTDEVDSFVPQTLGKYADKDFRSVTQEDLGLSTDEEKKEAAEQAEKSKATLEFVKTTLGDAVKEVRLSDNLGTHPVCMVPEEGMTFEMEKYFQRLNPEMGMKAGRILELNPNHRLFGLLQVAVAQDEEKAKKIAKILYAQALLMADLPLENPGEYTDLVCELVQ